MLRTIKTWEGSTWFIMNTYLTFVNIFFSCLCQDYKMVTFAKLYRYTKFMLLLLNVNWEVIDSLNSDVDFTSKQH